MSTITKRLNALEKARDNAKDTDFKLLWEQKRIQLLKSITPNVPAGGDLLNGWPEDGEPDYDTV
jgi:hypothetical protein|tara:strand:- start:1509 stop:1700 length:192 start_codon:yes stop_codon:yes gene_type:complete